MGKRKRDKLLESIADTIADYREGEIPAPTPDHVDKWIKQFDKSVQEPLLYEVDYVLKHTYVSKKIVREFLSKLVTNSKIAGEDPCEYWKNVEFLDIQQGGESQTEMLEMFDTILQEECDFGIADCKGDDTFIYLDDAIFTGNRVLGDLRGWIKSDLIDRAHVHVIVMAFHKLGQWYANKNIQSSAKISGKNIELRWWRCIEVENRKANKNVSEVLWPATIPDDPLVIAYVDKLKREGFPPELRDPKMMGELEIFSSKDGRDLLEQELLRVGARIKTICPLLGETQRPLGHSTLKTLGFGGLIITFRNCPNNTPLAFWVGDPWYPLFPRKTN